MVQARHSYVCYGLVCRDGRHTYVGITNCLRRRLRQHNGEIAGGARYTKRYGCGAWRLAAFVRGFGTHREAAGFEWDTKHGKATRIRCHCAVARVMLRLGVAAASGRWRRSTGFVVPLSVCYVHPTIRCDTLDRGIRGSCFMCAVHGLVFDFVGYDFMKCPLCRSKKNIQ